LRRAVERCSGRLVKKSGSVAGFASEVRGARVEGASLVGRRPEGVVKLER
jgi:hypothetical protein